MKKIKRLYKILHDACDILKLVKMQSWGKLKCPFTAPSDKSNTGTEVDSASRVNQHKVSTPGLKSKTKVYAETKESSLDHSSILARRQETYKEERFRYDLKYAQHTFGCIHISSNSTQDLVQV